jgi:hypothetical protein
MEKYIGKVIYQLLNEHMAQNTGERHREGDLPAVDSEDGNKEWHQVLSLN